MQPGTEIGKMARKLFRRRRKGPGLRQLRARKYVQLSLRSGLNCQVRVVTIEPKERIKK